MTKNNRDNVIYLLVSLTVVGVACLVSLYQADSGAPLRLPLSFRQIAIGTSAAVCLGYVIKQLRRAWKKKSFWLAFTMLSLVYIPLHWIALEQLHISIVALPLIVAIELFVILVLLEKIIPHAH